MRQPGWGIKRLSRTLILSLARSWRPRVRYAVEVVPYSVGRLMLLVY